jgi:tRNA-specific 2-thiouridylase
VFNLTETFDDVVVAPYVRDHAAGRTPTPCVECNRSIKFGALLTRAEALGFEAVATGHHARVTDEPDGSRALRRGADAAKDQSYVLYMLGQPELQRARLPVGDLTKAEVRAHATRLGLRTASKPESMDVCFITRGATLGAHDGVSSFTIGQRRGLGVATGERRYVVDVDASTATVTLGARGDLLRDSVTLRDVTFVDGSPAGRPGLSAQTRAHGTPVASTFDGTTVRFVSPQPRVAPGQVVALYADDALLGGGIAS